jgi:hypothetical protein
MRKFLIVSISILNLMNCQNAFSAIQSAANNLAGKYVCNGYDREDKALWGTTMIITFDTKNSILQNGYGAYHFEWKAPSTIVVKGLPSNIEATGSIASNGNNFALSFKNTNPKAPTDYGTAIGVITHDQDRNGISQTVLHIFSYQPVYKGGDNSSWVCTKR